DREEVLDVRGRGGIVGELLGSVVAQAQEARADTGRRVPALALAEPVLVPIRRLVRRDEGLHLHLLELAGAKDEVPRGDLVAERLADLGDSERGLSARELKDVLEVD